DRREVESRPARALRRTLAIDRLVRAQATGQRTPHHQSDLLVVQERHDLAVDILARNRVEGLDGLEAREAAMLGNAERLHELPRRPIRAADVTHQPALHEMV